MTLDDLLGSISSGIPSAPPALPSLGVDPGLPGTSNPAAMGSMPSQSMGPLMPTAMPPAAPRRKSGTDTVLTLAPMVLSMFAARKNPQHSAALIQGMLRGQDAARAQRLDAQERDEAKRREVAKFMQAVAVDAQQFDDPIEHQKYIEYATVTGDTAFGRGSMSGLKSLAFPATKQAARVKAEAAKKLSELEREPTLAGHIDTPEFETFTVTMSDGSRRKVSELRSLAGLQLSDPTGRAVAPKRELGGNSDEAQYRRVLIADFRDTNGREPNTAELRRIFEDAKGGRVNASDVDAQLSDLTASWQAKNPGQPITAEVRAQLRVAAKQQIGQADDRTPKGTDPTLAAIRELTLSNLRRNSAGDVSPGQATVGGKLADDFRAESKEFIQTAQAFNRVRASAADPSAAGDLALIFNYMKTLDPGSTVREGEFATAQNAGGIPDRITAVYNRAINGERLAPTQRADFLNRSRRLYTQALSQQRRIEQQYRQRAKSVNVPADFIITDYSVADEEAPSPDRGRTLGPKIGEQRIINGKPGEWDGRGWLPVGAR